VVVHLHTHVFAPECEEIQHPAIVIPDNDTQLPSSARIRSQFPGPFARLREQKASRQLGKAS